MQLGQRRNLEKAWVIEDLEALSVLVPRNGKTESWPLVGGMGKF